MEMLRVLCLVIVVIIISNSSCISPNPKEESNLYENGSVIFQDTEKKIEVKHNHFVLEKQINEDYLITIKNKEQLELIRKLQHPLIKFHVDNEVMIAKGLPLRLSAAPKGCDYFFSTCKDGIICFHPENSIRLRKRR